MLATAHFGFQPAFLDTATFSIYLLRDGFPIGCAVKARLVPGYERNGFFYTRSATARAVAEWTPCEVTDD